VSEGVESNSGMILTGENQYWEENLFHWHSVQHEHHMDWPTTEASSPHW